MKLTDPRGKVVLDKTEPRGRGHFEWIVKKPAPGLWRMDFTLQGRASFELYGVPPLLWTDANNLLVPKEVKGSAR